MLSVIIGLGANCGDRRAAVESAIGWLGTILFGFQSSEIYESPCYGHPGPLYMNAVVKGIWDGTVDSLDKICKSYELDKGRDEKARAMGIVPIDIDIVVAGNEVLRPADFKRPFFRKGYLAISEPTT